MNPTDLRTQTIRSLGFTTLLGSPKPYNELTPQQQVDVTWEMMRFVNAHPDDFPAVTVERAKKWLAQSGGVNTPLADTSLGASLSEFGGAMANEALAITKAGGNVIKNAVYIAAVVGIVVYFSPQLVKAAKEAKWLK